MIKLSMDLNDIELLPGTKKTAKTCHKCGSVFITIDECESCGLQFRPHDLGELLGPRSFFSLRENFEGKKDYRKNLIIRFRALLDGLEKSFDDLDSWNTLNYELLELARYLASSPKNKTLLNRILLDKRDHPQFFELNQIIQNGNETKLPEIDPYPFKKTIYFLGFLLLLVPLCMVLNKTYFMP